MNIFLSDDNCKLEIFSSAVTLLTVSMYAALASLYQGIGSYEDMARTMYLSVQPQTYETIKTGRELWHRQRRGLQNKVSISALVPEMGYKVYIYICIYMYICIQK
jgi:hypothetical protein